MMTSFGILGFKISISCKPGYKLLTAKFQILQLFESNFTEVCLRHPKTQSSRHYDVILQYLSFKIAHFVKLNRSYQPAKFH